MVCILIPMQRHTIPEIMILNFIKIIFRNFIRFKTFSLLNIIGLSVGIATSLLMLSWTMHEWSYDLFHDKIDRIHQVWIGAGDGTSFSSYGPGPLAPALKSNYPEIENSARTWFTWRHSPVRYNKETFFGKGCGVEPEFFMIFSFHFKQGNPDVSLNNPYFIIPTEEFATKLFKQENPIGKTVEFEIWGRWTEFTVTGIIEDVPSNSTLEFDFLLPFLFMEEVGWDMQAWDIFAMQSYVLLRENSSLDVVNEKVHNIIKEHDAGSQRTIHLQLYSQVHLSPMSESGMRKYVILFSSIAILILVVAIFNYINLTTAQYSKRIKGIGIRKVFGSGRVQLIFQYLTESFVVSCFSVIPAVIIIELIYPICLRYIGMDFISLYTPEFFLLLFFIVILTAILSGLYPAFFLSSFPASTILKGVTRTGKKGTIFRQSLVSLQFLISVSLIIFAIILNKQMFFIHNKELGFDKEIILNVKLRGSFYEKYDLLKQALLTDPDIISMTQTNSGYLNNGSSTFTADWEGKVGEKKVSMDIHTVDYDYLETFGLKMVSGRFFSENFSTDYSEAFVLNESAIKAMELQSPIGKQFSCYVANQGKEGKIIGIIQDFHFRTLHHQIAPMILTIAPWWSSNVFIRINRENIPETLNFLTKNLKELLPDYPIDYSFLNEDIDNLYASEKRIGILVDIGTVIAIFISCLGLFGFSLFFVDHARKEIGIRKVNGATGKEIIFWMAKKIGLLISVSFLLGGPIAFFVGKLWLQGFAYRITLGPGIFIMAGIIVILISFLTVSYQTLKAANTNPVDSLRYE